MTETNGPSWSSRMRVRGQGGICKVARIADVALDLLWVGFTGVVNYSRETIGLQMAD